MALTTIAQAIQHTPDHTIRVTVREDDTDDSQWASIMLDDRLLGYERIDSAV